MRSTLPELLDEVLDLLHEHGHDLQGLSAVARRQNVVGSLVVLGDDDSLSLAAAIIRSKNTVSAVPKDFLWPLQSTFNQIFQSIKYKIALMAFPKSASLRLFLHCSSPRFSNFVIVDKNLFLIKMLKNRFKG